MFDKFRESVRLLLKSRGLTYRQLSEISGLAISTLKCFMCAANDSRRVAEKIADALTLKLIYKDGEYIIYHETDVEADKKPA